MAMDHLKAEIAAAVRNEVMNLRRRVVDTGIGTYATQNHEELTVTIVDDLNTSIRVRTPRGPRYFNVKVSEQL